MKVDFSVTAVDYATYRAGFPESFFGRLISFGIGLPDQVVVDLGTGTGTLARGFAKQGCQVIGIDPAESLLLQAERLDRLTKVNVEYQSATAEKTGLPSSLVDVVTAGQCWHWFNRPAAAREINRILRPNGQVVIAHFDWIPLKGNVVEATEKLISEFNPTWNMGGGNGLYPLWLRDLGEAGFVEIESFSYDLDVPYLHEAWRGRIRASAGVGASLSQEKVIKFDKTLERMLKERFPQPTLQVHHRLFAVIARKRHKEEKYELKS